MRIRFMALVVLGLAGCGIYGPPERAAAPAAQTPSAEQGAEASDAGAPAETCADEEKPQ